jgi:hypothetical protein
MLLRTKSLIAFLCLLCLSSVALVRHLYVRQGATVAEWLPALKGHPVNPCPDKLDWLATLDLTYPIRYAHRDILVNPTLDCKRASITKVAASLFPDFQTIDLTDDPKIELQHCAKPLVLDVPAFAEAPSDASHLIFGISTTLRRLDESIPQLLRWLPGTHAKLFVIVIESERVGATEGQEETPAIKADPKQKDELQSRMRGLGMDATLFDPLALQDIFSEKYFSLVKIMYDNRNEKTQWVNLVDDDTFFPSMPAVVSMLGRYDPSEQHYIGGLSEDWWSVTKYGMMGFGGAGVFLSVTLAEVLASNYQLCKETSYANAGDIRVMECIHLLTDTKLTSQRNLHQVDLDGDLSGIYESGRLPLSLHHWKTKGNGGKGYNLPVMHLVSDVCGECFLQRWQFGKDMILSNGYSIATYPNKKLKELHLMEMEATWGEPTVVDGSDNHGIDHSLAPTRPALTLDEEKIQYKLIDSAVVEGGVRQSYLHKGLAGDIDSLLELFWMEKKEVEGERRLRVVGNKG